MTEFCKFHWDNFFLHYIFWGIIGPIICIVLSFFVAKKLFPKFWIKALLLITSVNLVTCTIGNKTLNFCEISIFGEINDDPGDIGIVFMTFPIWIICCAAALIVIYFIYRKKRKSYNT